MQLNYMHENKLNDSYEPGPVARAIKRIVDKNDIKRSPPLSPPSRCVTLIWKFLHFFRSTDTTLGPWNVSTANYSLACTIRSMWMYANCNESIVRYYCILFQANCPCTHCTRWNRRFLQFDLPALCYCNACIGRKAIQSPQVNSNESNFCIKIGV